MTTDKGSRFLLKVEAESEEELEDLLEEVLGNDSIECANFVKKPSRIKRLARKMLEKHIYGLIHAKKRGEGGD